MIYLYNELAALREHVDSLQALGAAPRVPESASLAFALARRNKPIAVFAVCPQKSFVQETLDTQELWKNKQAETAFEVMEEATKSILTDLGSPGGVSGGAAASELEPQQPPSRVLLVCWSEPPFSGGFPRLAGDRKSTRL